MEKTDRTSISRLAGRGSYDIHQINAILDEALLCTVSYVEQGRPFSIPTGFVRVGNQLVIHGSVGSHFMRQIADGRDLCVVITLLDGLVLARSIFDSSMNYRSVVLFSKAVTVDALEEKRKYFEAYTEKVLPGRWADVRQPSDKEINKTLLMTLEISEASAKIREGLPFDGEDERDPAVWWGVLPMHTVYGEPQPHPQLKEGVEFPTYLKKHFYEK